MFRKALIGEYVSWLSGYLAGGGEATHCYDYPWSRADFLVASADFQLGGECGSSARPIIVEPGARWLGGQRGHNNLYRLSDFEHLGGWVPVYSDPAFDALPGIAEFRRREQAKDAAAEAERQKYAEAARKMQESSDLSRYLGRLR